YPAVRAHIPPALSHLPVRYRDYVLWQRERCDLPAMESQRQYWQKKLHGLQPLDFPTDRVRPATRTAAGGRVNVSIPGSLVHEARELARSEEASLFMVLLGVFQGLLHRYTSQDDVAVGSPIANRTQPEIENLIGFFVNTLVLRTEFSHNPTFRNLLVRVRNTVAEAFDNADVPFEEVVDRVSPGRDISYNPLFQTNFAFQPSYVRPVSMDGLVVSEIHLANTMTRFDLEMHVRNARDEMPGEIIYSTEIFNQNTIERFQRHYSNFLKAVVANPDYPIADLAILDESEYRQIVLDWNQTLRDIESQCIPALIEQQVKRVPDAPAIMCDGQILSYRQLNSRANQL